MPRPVHSSPGAQRARVTRRTVVAAGAAAAVGGLGALADVLLGGSSRRRPRHLAMAPTASPPTSPATSPPPTAAVTTTTTTAANSPIPGVVIAPVPVRTSPVFTVHEYLPNAPANAVALTIDDGPDPRWTPAVLAELAQYGVKATFSLVGIHVAQQPDVVRMIVAEGHGVCNHSMTHPQPFASRPQLTIDAEIAGGLREIYAATGRVANLFRSPAGDWSPGVFAAVAQWGMTPIDWDVDPRDWARPGSAAIIGRMLAARPGDIMLCHDGGGDRSQTVMALRTAIPALQARGLQFVTL